MSTRRAPKHLSNAAQAWWKSVLREYRMEPHHERILTLAAEAWDRTEQARAALAEHGDLTFVDRHGAPRARPEVQIERDSRIAFARLVRELDLDSEPAPVTRPPRRT